MVKTPPELRIDLEKFTEDSIALRFSVEIPGFAAEAVDLNKSLIEVQEILSQLESLLSKSIRAKAALDRKAAHLRMVWQQAWDEALIKKKPGFGGDFVTGKEKAADANLATFNQTRVLRSLEEDCSFANEAVDVIRLHYYGLDKIRQDVRKRLDMSQTDYYS